MPATIAVESYKHNVYNYSSEIPVRERVMITVAGNNTGGYSEGTGAAATFNVPTGVAVDNAGNIYVADQDNHRIRKITAAGVVSTLAGNGMAGFSDGPGTTAKFNMPIAIATDVAGNIYVADYKNHRIRKILPSGLVTTLAGNGTPGFGDGPGAFAQFNGPAGVATDASGNVYVGDIYNNRIRKISPAGIVSTVAGNGNRGIVDGAGTVAQFNYPSGVAVDASGNIFVADNFNHRIRKITAAGVVSTFAGSGAVGTADGTGTAASFNKPFGIVTDAAGNVYVGDNTNHRIRVITPAGVVSTFAGSHIGYADGAAKSRALLDYPNGVAIDAAGNIFIADSYNYRIRKITLTEVETGAN